MPSKQKKTEPKPKKAKAEVPKPPSMDELIGVRVDFRYCGAYINECLTYMITTVDLKSKVGQRLLSIRTEVDKMTSEWLDLNKEAIKNAKT